MLWYDNVDLEVNALVIPMTLWPTYIFILI